MGSTLESLLTLQDVEHQIVDIRRQLASRERAVKRQAAKVRAGEENLEQERQALKRAQVQMDEVDLDLKGRNANVEKLRENLNSVKTNKEYAAVLSQLNNEKADVSRLESRAYELMEGVEAQKKVLAEHQGVLEQEKQRLADLEGQYAQARETFSSRLTDLEGQRAAQAQGLDATTLELFDRISERYEGEVMAEVVQPHPRRQEYMCDGCNMSLAAERANALLTKDDVITCDNCGRILYIKRDA